MGDDGDAPPPTQLPASIPILPSLDRPVMPFSHAVLQCIRGDATEARRLSALVDIAAELDATLGTLVDSMRIKPDADDLAILFQMGEHAVAVTPIGYWPERLEGSNPLLACPTARHVDVRVAEITDGWFPPERGAGVELEVACQWIVRNVMWDLPTVTGQRPPMVKYAGPRLFGESFWADLLLPTLLEGCQIL